MTMILISILILFWNDNDFDFDLYTRNILVSLLLFVGLQQLQLHHVSWIALFELQFCLHWEMVAVYGCGVKPWMQRSLLDGCDV